MDFSDPRPDMFDVFDIAWALSRIQRYTGHAGATLDMHYSVAEHCVLGARMLQGVDALAFLMHDASEAYMNDIASPLKKLLPDYCIIEKQIMDIILEKYCDPMCSWDNVKAMDENMLSKEMPALFSRNYVPGSGIIQCWKPERAFIEFMTRFAELTHKQ